MGNGYVADIYGALGYDFVWVDTEHSGIDYGELLNCITILKAHKTPVIVRLQMDNYNHTKKVLEMGPDGVIFPYVETAEYADKCMKSTLYPPIGTRGSGPLRAVRYGLDDLLEYAKDQENNLCRFIQIESEKGVKNLPEIVKNPYIDGVIFGIYDMSATIDKFTDVYSKENMALINESMRILKENGKYVGVSFTSTEYAEQKRWYDYGADMVSCGAEFDYIVKGSKKNAEQLRKLIAEYEK
jgi:2-dehydro-3-deoxyglucarate aldolase/4-hydroxy-2-oxoheptanedioate aldolase